MASPARFKLLIHSARQVVKVVENGELFVRGQKMRNLAILEDEEGISIVVDHDGNIANIGKDKDVAEKYRNVEFENKLDAKNKAVIPGLVDAHTHPVWAGDRVHEFEMKLGGATYMDIHLSGGGIYYTVRKTRDATEEELLDLLTERLTRMMKSGTTLVEAKSGYGLDCCSEMKLLRVIERARDVVPVDLSSTFCGAHSLPEGMTSEEATRAVIEEQIPKLKELIDRGEIKVDSVDVFCEKNVFNLEQSRRILEAGRSIGLRMNFHGDELYPMGAAEMGAGIGAEAISHLEEISDAGIHAMAKVGSIAVILPTTAYILRLPAPPVRKMLNADVAVCLGTDFNPNAYCLSMPITMHLACVNLGMTMAETLTAATINSAAALGKSRTHGSLEIGKVADMLILGCERWEHLIYQLGGHDRLIRCVIKNGNIVYSALDSKSF